MDDAQGPNTEFNDLAYRKPFGNPVDCFLHPESRRQARDGHCEMTDTGHQCSLSPMAGRWFLLVMVRWWQRIVSVTTVCLSTDETFLVVFQRFEQHSRSMRSKDPGVW
uniref:Uncharacterized protein n=1 Tax=Daphnia galeata TaxID=27404 RepID=A0A8J2RDE6_9CRUS|nr:unnamed protein product [Daphnia galeata]